MASLLLMPDEIKIKIFSYLSGTDKLELLKVCKDFNRIGVDRNIIKRLNFNKCYKLTLPQLRFLARQETAPLITHLNLNGVHWITSAALRDALIKFTNLTNLFLLDTQLNFRDMDVVFKATNKVTKLAIAMKQDFCSDIIEKPITLPLTHLYVVYNSYAIRVLVQLFSNMKSLKELWVIETKIPVSEFVGEDLPWLFTIRSLKTKVVNKIVFTRQYGESYYGKVFLDSLMDNVWRETKKYVHNRAIFHQYDAFYGNKRTKKVKLEYWNNLSFFLRAPVKELQEQIRLRNNNEEIEEIKRKFLYTEGARNIWKLKCNSSIFWRERKDTKKEVEEPMLFKKRRIGLNAVKLDDNLKFKEFSINTPNMQAFEIEDLDCTAVRDNLWHINDLIFIQNWKMLKKLTITSINMYTGNFFIDIVINCPMLECLKIQDDMVQDNISINLCNALVYAQNLKDLRFQRKGSIPIDSLFESLANCSKLERLYVQCASAVKISKKPLETVMTMCENIIFLFIYISELPETFCKSIKQSMTEFGIRPQQIINIRGQSYKLHTISYEDIPRCHIEEMVCQGSEPYWNLLDTFFH